ncbi:MAG: hypothetical protein M4579_000157 [Chaenotheca gracillima]|nr:MAG: hypothetical protein M4579_000157 [Chaenotheca gracillima]
MSGSFEKSVKGGTKIKLAAPKSKYVEHILVATHAGEAGVAEVFRALQNRLRDSTWTIVFKGLIIIHLMIREGEPDVTLKYIAANPRKLVISEFSDERGGPVQAQGANIRHYMSFILERARAFRETRLDFVRSGEGRLKRLSVDKGLLRETETVQHQITALLKCNLLSDEPENEITLTAFRLLVTDLLALFYVMNEGVINILEHFFEMSKVDAERALVIYKTFSKQTNYVVEYLAVARQYENATRLEVPKLKHAPTSLTGSLEEYLHDPDFDINRRQYLAQQDAKKGRGRSPVFKSAAPKTTSAKDFPDPKPAQPVPARQEPKGPAPDLIDFFESIEQNQQPLAQSANQQTQQQQPQSFPNQVQLQQQQQQVYQPGIQQPGYTGQQPQAQLAQQYGTAFNQHNNSPFDAPQQQSQLQYNSSGAGLVGYTAPQNHQGGMNPQQTPFSPMQQQAPASQQQFSQQTGPPNGGQASQATNPFRQSTMAQNTAQPTTQPFSNSPITSPLNRQNTNPFARNLNSGTGPSQTMSFSPQDNSISSFQFPQAPQQQQQQQQQQYPQSPPQQSQQQTPQPLSSTATGTNPFARNPAPQQPQVQNTGPAQNGLVSQPTGSTNPFRQSMFQNQQTGTFGGHDLQQVPTMPIFPRQGQQPQQQTGQGQQGW